MRVDPGADGAFGDETEADTTRRFRKERYQRRTIIAGKIEAKVESSPDKIQPKLERTVSIIDQDFVYIGDRRHEFGRMMVN